MPAVARRPGKSGDMRRVLEEAQKLGWELVKGRKNWKLVKEGAPPVFIPSTPSSPRSCANSLANLRRADRAIAEGVGKAD